MYATIIASFILALDLLLIRLMYNTIYNVIQIPLENLPLNIYAFLFNLSSYLYLCSEKENYTNMKYFDFLK